MQLTFNHLYTICMQAQTSVLVWDHLAHMLETQAADTLVDGLSIGDTHAVVTPVLWIRNFFPDSELFVPVPARMKEQIE